VFFSRTVMGRLGRDPGFFRYVDADVAATIAARIERGLTEGDPAANPYLRWIAYGRHADALPHAWREENFGPIRSALDCLELRTQSIEAALAAAPDASVDRFNLSDVFEYVSEAGCARMFEDLARCGRPGGRVAYWNMMVPRRAPAHLAPRLVHCEEESRRLARRAKACFYGAFCVDEVGPRREHRAAGEPVASAVPGADGTLPAGGRLPS
jgi:S-adenosylmethionine-diacylglycerol 3-amino-3-carboxypropyl transferase